MSIEDKMAEAIAQLLKQGKSDAAMKLLDALLIEDAQATKTVKMETRTKKENFPSRLKAVAVARRAEYQISGVYRVDLFYDDVQHHLNSLPAAVRCQRRIIERFNVGSKLAKAAWEWYSNRTHLSIAS